ncbi:hypothetical protein VCHA53O463_40148 [Vibrio chagasii]|nr:hypothetical protein [Vibrio chagasii]CAH7353379.1 hypothetical protein VCHA56P515_50123 [Vibrio chagasii]CAH7379161.1 hypothetical protein VCHA53O463_40148 [Vibrio chagasii]
MNYWQKTKLKAISSISGEEHSKRLAVSLRLNIGKRRSHPKAALSL